MLRHPRRENGDHAEHFKVVDSGRPFRTNLSKLDAFGHKINIAVVARHMSQLPRYLLAELEREQKLRARTEQVGRRTGR